MRARHRHFNPKDAGAGMALDSRFMTGTNGSGVSSWSNRANSSNNAAQSTVAEQPIYETGSLNGNPGVKFDNTDDWLSWVTAIQMRFGLCLFKSSGTQIEFGSMWGTSDNSASGIQHLFGSSNRWVSTSFSPTRWTNAVFRKNGSTFTATNANSVSSDADIISTLLEDNGGVGISRMRDRANNRGIYGLLYQYQVFSNEPSSSLIKRLQFSSAYSFKIACS
ncbi:MAG: hypothetical protein KGR46_10930 [Verrucomicrobia bacterium]|nr:hypothetical protein [Verrucomicrobiota bacterium]